MPKSIKKHLLIILGSLALALGVIGIFIPLLPTTPFLLLASFCYIRSSEKLYQWLMTHKIFGACIYNYITYKAVSKRIKVGTLIILWATLILSILLAGYLHVRIILVLIGLGVTMHLCTLKNLK